MIRTLAAALATTSCIVALATPAAAQTREYDIAQGALKDALDAYILQSGRQVVYRADQVRTARSSGVRGSFSPEAALAALLEGSGFTSRTDGELIAIVQLGRNDRSTSPVAAEDSENTTDNEIVVTGSRIRGARSTGEVTTVEREQIVEAGQVDLGETLRSLPQNFSGGQNPGVGSGGGLVNENVSSASSANLRGLGPDATLTLLNGHRLPYNSAFQGVDISAIPIAAVDRIEVVPDGASAVYGSDAVGGVINVILRRDFEGVTTSGQIGTSTDDGYFRKQVDVVAGTVWDLGGLVLAYDFADNSRIEARDRDYTSILLPETTLFPPMTRHAATLAGHHKIAPDVEIALDALYSYRESTVAGGTPTQKFDRDNLLETFAVTPSVKFDLGSRWRANLVAVYGSDRTEVFRDTIPAVGATTTNTVRYTHEIFSMEAGVEGPLFSIPGGDVRLAAGAGFRNNRLDYALITPGLTPEFDVTQRSRFAYSELYVPIFSDQNSIDGIELLTLSAAVRYEDYESLDRLATPRIGAVYSPVEGLVFRGSWARSFKAPTLYQQNFITEAILIPSTFFGVGSGSDALLLIGGGNPDLTPEKSESWTLGFEFTPDALPGLSISASWFDIDYEDRVVRPISGSISAALRNPGYESLIDFSPDPMELNALIASAQFGLENFTGQPYDPANVVVLYDNRNINVSAWKIEGIDAKIAWRRDFEGDRSFGIDLSGSWLKSEQQITPDLPPVRLAGTIFNPPRFRGRGTVRYQAGPITTNAAVNYIGALEDRRIAQIERLSPSATIDFGLHYELVPGEKRDPGLEISITVQNVLNDKPNTISQTGPTDTPYDSTNYSPIGRFIAFGIRRHW